MVKSKSLSSQNKKILVIDDDQGILEVIKIVLEDRKYQITALETGKNVKSLVNKIKPDLILLDLWMKDIDGKTLASELKKSKASQNIPLILISALNDADKIAKEVKANGFLQKPFNIEDLVLVVEENIK